MIATGTPAALFQFPEQSRFGRQIPKSKIYEKARPSNVVRELFVTQVDSITWQYKLAPETINLPARGGVTEIQVFDIALRSAELDERVLACIDKAIPHPILFQLHLAANVQMKAAYKRPSDADSGKWVVGDYFSGSWQPADGKRQVLPVALELASLYEQVLRSVLPLSSRMGETLRDQVLRIEAARKLERECSGLQAQLVAEKQFNRKVEINATLRTLKQELAALTK
jgi:hypothetical protein